MCDVKRPFEYLLVLGSFLRFIYPSLLSSSTGTDLHYMYMYKIDVNSMHSYWYMYTMYMYVYDVMKF